MTDHKGETPQVSEWPETVLLGRRKYTDDPLREMPEIARDSALHDTKRYIPISRVKEKLNALERELLEFARVCRDEASAHNETALKSAGLEYAADALHELATSFPDTPEEQS